MIEVKRGQVGHSERTLARRWRWSRGRANRFIRDLETLQQIEPRNGPQNKRVTTLITIANYDHYQSDGATERVTERVTDGPQTGHRRGQNKNDKEVNIYSKNSFDVLSYLNSKTGKRYRDAKHIEARLQAGATVEDCKRVIDTKILDPYFIDNPKYLNPQTLFRPSNFDKYVNEAPISHPAKSSTTYSTCPQCKAQIPPHDRTPDGCIYCQYIAREVKPHD